MSALLATTARSDAPRLLLVDDDDAVRRVFEQFLNLTLPDLIIDNAVNGREALMAVKKHAYQVCILDLHMPEMDGLSAFHAMRDICLAQNRAMPKILFCSGYAPTPAVERIVEENANCQILCKPLRLPDLSDYVKAAISGPNP